jgi:thiol:disulfide interchange protein DsbD
MAAMPYEPPPLSAPPASNPTPVARRRRLLLQAAAAAAMAAGLDRLRAAGARAAAPVARAEASHSRVELLAARADLGAREALWLGLRITPRAGWHSYWRNPGDAGLAPSLALDAAARAAGFRLGPIEWPAPRRIPVKQLASYGYDGAVLLPLLLFVPARLPAGASLALGFDASWLVCEESCIAQDAVLRLALGARTPEGAAPRADHAGLAAAGDAAGDARRAIAAALQQVPVAAPAGVAARARRQQQADGSGAPQLEVRIDGLPAAMAGIAGELFFEREEIVEPGPTPQLQWLPAADGRGGRSALWSTALGSQGKTLAPGSRLDAVWTSTAARQRALRLAVLVAE